MRILCAVGIRRGAELVRRVSRFAKPDDELILLHVLDEGPRHDLNHLHGTTRPHHAQRRELDSAEQEAGAATLAEAAEEAGRLGMTAAARLEKGNPEHMIAGLAEETKADVVALLARESPQGHPVQGPPSVGHTARFVVDHSPVDVILFREKAIARRAP